MLNQTVLVGRIANDPELRETEDGIKVTNITLAVPRSFKNEKGEYDTDFVDIVLWKGVAESTIEYCRKGDMVGVKGRLQTLKDKDDKTKISVVAERVTFLSTKSQEKEQEVER